MFPSLRFSLSLSLSFASLTPNNFAGLIVLTGALSDTRGANINKYNSVVNVCIQYEREER